MIGRAGLKYARDFTPNAQGFGGGHAAVDTFDYVIVGAGSAGCVLANRLSADPSVTVCLVEAGGSDRYIWIHIPVGYFYTFDNPRTDWRFRTEPDPGLNGRSIKYPRGRVLGGTSSINGMVYVRGQSRDYDGWRAAAATKAPPGSVTRPVRFMSMSITIPPRWRDRCWR